jgi:hypothetical protein
LGRVVNAFVLVIALFASANGQTKTAPGKPTTTNRPQPDFKSEGEQEYYWAKEAFATDYKIKAYPTYKSKIVINGDDYNYGKTVITASVCPEMTVLFKKGIIFPLLLFATDDYTIQRLKVSIRETKSLTETKTVSDTGGNHRNFARNPVNFDSLFVGSFEELKSLETSPKQRWFRFLLGIKGSMNPILYFIEFANKKATPNTDMLNFMKGADLTFLRQGSILI